MTHAPEHPRELRTELGYTASELQRLLDTRTRLLKHLDAAPTVVGGLSNRLNFPFYASSVMPRKAHDLDLLLPFVPANDTPQRTVRPSVRDDFAVTYILPDHGAYYFQLIDRITRLKVDLFVPERLSLAQTLHVREESLVVQRPEEAYFKVMRDLYRFLSAERPLDAKHAEFFTYADRAVDGSAVAQLWPQEQALLELEELSFAQYRSRVLSLVHDRSMLLARQVKRQPTYPTDSPTVHGVSIEPESEWYHWMGSIEH